LIALTKSLTDNGGSRSWSVSTSTQVISVAPASPGEQGVSFSLPSTVTCERKGETSVHRTIQHHASRHRLGGRTFL
jgi:hypothetical protein